MKIKGLLISATALLASPQAAHAAIVINITQAGNNVTATAAGRIDLGGLARSAIVTNTVGILPARGQVGFGGNVVMQAYTGFTGGGGFGTGATFVASSSDSGTDFGFDATGSGQPLVLLPLQFVSGGTIDSTSTFAGSSFASLGLVAGSYVFRSSADTITINVGDTATAVPEPATWGMMIFGFGAIGSAMRRRQKVRTNVTFA